MSELIVQIPSKLDFLREERHRYKGAWGGRGSAKSWSFARALLLIGIERSIRVLCARELQKSIKDSVHQLLCDQIDELDLHYHYDDQAQGILGKNGTTFGYAGLKHNISEIKSYEGADYVWVEEAQVVSKKSWKTLIPTIRKEGSEIWLTFNPELEEDPTYQLFVDKPPKDSKIVTMNWRDNPWFPEVLNKERLEEKERDMDSYLHIWEGHCKQVLDGAIFANELRKAKEENRITDVPYDPTKPVHTFWDLGWNSLTGRTAIIMAQSLNNKYQIIDYLEDAEHTVDWYVQKLQKRPYVWGTDYLPHDADSTNLAAGGRTVAKIMRGLNRKVIVLKRTSKIGNDINACRTIWGQLWIDKTKCADLLQCLGRYRYAMDEETGLRSKKPEANIWTHGNDAFRQFGVAITDEKQPRKKRESIKRTSDMRMFG